MPHDPPVSAYTDPQAGVTALEGAAVGTAPDDNGVEVLQAGASALGGAIVGIWLYRRRHPHDA